MAGGRDAAVSSLCRHDVRQTARFQGVCVEHLIAAAAVIRNQQGGLAQRHQLGQGIAARAGEHDICTGERVRQFVRQIFKLPVTRYADQRRIQIALAADMQHVEFLRQFRQGGAEHRIDRLRAQRTADHHQNGLAAVKTRQFQPARTVAGENLRAKRSARLNAFRSEKLCALRKRGADGFCKRLAQLVCQPRRDVALVHHHGHAADGRAENDRHADKTALGKDDIPASACR